MVIPLFPRSNYRGFFTTGESYCTMYTLCSAVLRVKILKSPSCSFSSSNYASTTTEVRRFQKDSQKSLLFGGELKSRQCHQATVDFQLNVLNPSPSIMLCPPLRCLFHWEIQTLCCLSKMLFIEAVSFLLCVNLRELISAVKVALTWELIYAQALPTQFLLLPVNFSIFNVASGQGEYLLKEWIPQWVSDEWAVIKSWQNGKWCHMYTT